MNRDDVKQVLIEEIGRIAPEADLSALPSDVDLREELDIDSFDFQNLVIALHERLGVDIPELDYPKLYTFGGAIDYLASEMQAHSAAAPSQG